MTSPSNQTCYSKENSPPSLPLKFPPPLPFPPPTPCQDAGAWAASLQQAQLAAETGDFDEIRRRLRSAGRLNRTECEALNPLAPPFKVRMGSNGG